jgi:precorrin-4 methylase
MKKLSVGLVTLAVLWFVCRPCVASPPSLSITGLVRQPLNLTLEDLNGLDSIKVQLNELMQDGRFRGVFIYRGVPLKSLLELAHVEKEETAFGKKVDLAIRVRGENGKVVSLSWGEVFYRNPGRIIVAFSAQPIRPKKTCTKCHTPEEYQPRMDQLERKILFPKLVIDSDIYADRSLDGITAIEVLDLCPKMPSKKMDRLHSKELSIMGDGIEPKTFRKLSAYPRTRMTVKHLGEGRGYHGMERLEGTYFKALLDKMNLKPDPSQVFLVSAPDGYRSLFSYGEIFLNPAGDRMILADKLDGKPIEPGGKFMLVPPDDLMSDRDVKAVQKIEIISLRPTPRLYVIGMGCGDTNLITLKAISHISKADAFVCPPDLRKRFSKYIGDKPVLLNIYEFAPPRLRKANPGLTQEKFDALMKEKRENAVKIITESQNKGKIVAVLDYGDPTIWSGWSWMTEYFGDEMLEIIPGLSSFNVSNALIERKMGCNGSIILTTSRGIMENPDLLKPLSKKGETICIFMGLKDLETLVPEFKKYYEGGTPACLAYKAGYAGSEHLIRTTLDGLQKAANEYHEKFLGLIYIGPCLAVEEKEFCH